MAKDNNINPLDARESGRGFFGRMRNRYDEWSEGMSRGDRGRLAIVLACIAFVVFVVRLVIYILKVL